MSDTYLRLASIFPFFVPAVRDYIDVLNNVYASVSNDINLQQVLQQSFLFVLTSMKFSFFYLISFQWIRDLPYLPILIPQLKIEILKEHFFLQTPQSTFFTFLEIPSYINNKFLLGFFNSFFLCLPLSVAHIISTRRLLIQGRHAGISSSLGTVFGQILLVSCILFGGRFFIIPWFNFQIVNYIVGICLVLNIIYDMAHERSIRIIDRSNTSVLAKIFLLNFALAWTEQSCIFQYFGNLTFGAEPTILEIFSSPTALQSILTHLTYILGIIVGSLVFTLIFSFLCVKLNEFIVAKISILYTRWIRRLNFSLITLMIAFTFTSIPFYSFNYLVLSNLGFVSQDKGLQNTVFLPTKICDCSPPVLGNPDNLCEDKKPGIDTDITPFDKGRYLMFDTDDNFENLNYKGEYAWLTRKHQTPTVSRDPSSFAIIRPLMRSFQKLQKPITKPTSSRTKKIKKIASQSNTNTNLEPVKTTNEENDLIQRLKSRRLNEQIVHEFYENLVNKSFLDKFWNTNEIDVPIIEKKLKQKYYSNPVYKLLLSADIDFFLSRQPRSFSLDGKQENDLFFKRLMLANYYDSLRYYTTLPYVEEFEEVFNGSKSYADRIYNHQFKGTLKIVRRLFSINIPKNDTDSQDLILKFDQPLYKTYKKSTTINNNSFNPVFHEEFYINKVKNLKQTKDKENLSDFKKQLKQKDINSKNSFLKLTNPIPFYVGWDEELRKLVITNRLSPRSIAVDKSRQVDDIGNTRLQKNKILHFTTWPIPKTMLQNSTHPSLVSYNLMFESLVDLKNKFIKDEFSEENMVYDEDTVHKISKTENLPTNITKNGGKDNVVLEDIIPYTRGGFVWPGHPDLNFKFKNLK